MALQLSVAVRNATLDAIETAIGTAPTLEIRSGSVPASCAASDTGTLLASITLPSDWANAASGGAKTLLGTWQDASADAAGTAGHFRIKQGGTCHAQGTCSATGGGGDITFDNTVFAVGQEINIAGFTITAGGA
ncbi:MAG: hypothetical protein ACT4OK_11040 [Gemmobacter sp.]